MSDHRARPDDDPQPGDRCKDCGADITWIGPNLSDWQHVALQPIDDLEDDGKLYPVPTIGESIEVLRHIVDTGSMARLPGGLQCDSFSASAILSVYDHLGPEARAKFEAMLFLKGQAVAFKLIERLR
jgi:hypothetical protein